jgi:hypothetical protein
MRGVPVTRKAQARCGTSAGGRRETIILPTMGDRRVYRAVGVRTPPLPDTDAIPEARCARNQLLLFFADRIGTHHTELPDLRAPFPRDSAKQMERALDYVFRCYYLYLGSPPRASAATITATSTAMRRHIVQLGGLQILRDLKDAAPRTYTMQLSEIPRILARVFPDLASSFSWTVFEVTSTSEEKNE